MRRASLIGPLVLIVIGTLFLLHNLWPGLSLLSTVGHWWPAALIGWGVLRILEIARWQSAGRPLPQNGLSGGEWTFIVFLCVIGSAAFTADKYRDRWPMHINSGVQEWLGESFDYPQPEQVLQGSGKTPRVLIENLRGNARIVGADAETVRASGRIGVRSFQQADADKVSKDCKLEVVRQGDLIVIRTNQDRAGNSNKVSAELEITVPRGASIEARGRYGDFEIVDIAGAVTVDSDNAGVRINNVGGAVKVDTRNSDIIRVVNAKSTVDISGRGQDVELEGISGQATVTGSHRGELTFRNLAKPVRVEDSRTEVRCERIPGSMTMSRGDLNGNDVVGPMIIRGQSRDVELSNFTDSLEVSVERGDVDLRPGRLPVGKLDIKTRAGNVSLALPETAKFVLEATTDRGEVDNSYGSPLKEDRSGKGAKLEGAVGAGGPAIRLHTDRGQVSVSKGSSSGGGGNEAAPAAAAVPKVERL
jgi:DUF4097 and DUF4098 domain-containing protein YvlB